MNRVVVCICTYKRPEGLARLLENLTQLSKAKPDAVVVIDNNAEGDGYAVCKAMQSSYPYELHYAIEPTSGISFARNAAVSLALKLNPELLAFLDDDEWPEADWLAELTRVREQNNADAVGGPTLSVFPENTPEELRSNPYYGADLQIPDGAPCQLQAAGNFLIRAAMIKPMGPDYFHPAFAHSGGEDLAFFTTLAHNGATMCWAARAIVFEAVPQNRLSQSWIRERVINIANSRVRVMQTLEPGVIPAAIRGIKTVALFVQSTVWTILGVFSPNTKQEAAMLRWKFSGKMSAHLNRKTVRGEGH